MPPDKGGVTATPPNNRGKKEKRGEYDNKCRWWEEGCSGVAMDAINNQLGAAERQWTRDVNNYYNLDYVEDCGNDDDEDNGWGDRSRWQWRREQQQSLPLVKLKVAIAVKASGAAFALPQQSSTIGATTRIGTSKVDSTKKMQQLTVLLCPNSGSYKKKTISDRQGTYN